METVRILILSAALLFLIGLSGLISAGNFVSVDALTSNTGLIFIALVLLIFAVYLLNKQEIKLQIKKFFLEKSDEATLAYVRSELKKLKDYLNTVKKIDKRNAGKVFKALKSRLEKLSPYKVYISSTFAEGDFLENMNKILSFDKITSKNYFEFSLAVKKIKEELAEF
ncbi:MAG: hypothetical protein QXP52_02470 [Candidatus Aenigmatarchaeota archaeon]